MQYENDESPPMAESRTERDNRACLLFGFTLVVVVSTIECITASVFAFYDDCEYDSGDLNLAGWMIGNAVYALTKICFYGAAIFIVHRRMCPRAQPVLFDAFMVFCFFFTLMWMVWGIVIISGSDDCSDSRVYKASIAFILFRGLGALNTFLITFRDRVVTCMIA